MILTHNGPVDQYLKLTGKTKATFDKEVKEGDAGAVSLFGAEVLFGLLMQVSVLIESIPQTKPGDGQAESK